MTTDLILSSMPKTWIFDLDGTLVKHNGYKDSNDSLLPGVKEFLDDLPELDSIIILTARKNEFKDITLSFLKKNKIRYNHIIFDMPMGERILINDIKLSGLNTAYAVNLKRDASMSIRVKIDENL